MKYLFLDIYKKAHYRISKDTAGGYGTANDLGDGIFGRAISNIIKHTVSWPNLFFAQLLEELSMRGHHCRYLKTTELLSIKNIGDYDAIFICNSIVCFETELNAARFISNNFNGPIFLCGTVIKFSDEKLPSNCVILAGNYDLMPLNYFSSHKMLSELVQEKGFQGNKNLNNANNLSPIRWGSNGLDIPKNRFLGGKKHLIPYIFSRGCPYSCAEYCTYPTSQGKKVLSPEIEKCLDDLRWIEKLYPGSHVVFRDPVFSINIKVAKELLNAINEARLNLEFSAELHLRNLDDEFIRLASRANFKAFKFGIESAYDFVRKDVKRISVDNDEQYEIISKLKANSIDPIGMFILGQPADDIETCKGTIEYACNLKLKIAQFSIFTPYPGTSFFDLIREDVNTEKFEDFSQFQLVFKHQNLSKIELRALLEQAYFRFISGKLVGQFT